MPGTRPGMTNLKFAGWATPSPYADDLRLVTFHNRKRKAN
jgi:hypothetical protein